MKKKKFLGRHIAVKNKNGFSRHLVVIRCQIAMIAIDIIVSIAPDYSMNIFYISVYMIIVSMANVLPYTS